MSALWSFAVKTEPNTPTAAAARPLKISALAEVAAKGRSYSHSARLASPRVIYFGNLAQY